MSKLQIVADTSFIMITTRPKSCSDELFAKIYAILGCKLPDFGKKKNLTIFMSF